MSYAESVEFSALRQQNQSRQFDMQTNEEDHAVSAAHRAPGFLNGFALSGADSKPSAIDHQVSALQGLLSLSTHEGAVGTGSFAAASARDLQAPPLAPPPRLLHHPFDNQSSTIPQMLVESIAVQREGLLRLDEAMEMLPFEFKAAYLAALKHCPYLVQVESSPLRYLRHARYDAWAAARRLALYWAKRVDMFGATRAFLPLTVCGNGALDDDDIDAIMSGYFSALPNDSTGRSVLLYLPNKRRHDSRLTRLRVAFYFCSIMAENDVCQLEGFETIILLGMNASVGSKFDGTNREFVDFVMPVLPTFFSALHLVNIPSGIGQRIFYAVVLPLILNTLGGDVAKITVVHVGEPIDLLCRLGSCGFAPSGLPDVIGGTWNAEDRTQWFRQRFQVEYDRYRVYLTKSNLASRAIPIMPSTSVLPASRQPAQRDSRKQPSMAQFWTAWNRWMTSLPAEEKAAAAVAARDHSELFEKESDVMAFLRFENFSSDAAALRLITNWKIRNDAFGENTYQPLNQTGDGALTKKDLALLGSAFLMSLPRDAFGRPVLFLDASRLVRSSRDSQIRCTFYMFMIAAESEAAQTDGIVLLYAHSEPAIDVATQELLEVVLSVSPVHIRDVHIVPALSSDSDSDTVHAGMLQYFHRIARNTVVQHRRQHGPIVPNQFAAYGLKANGLPKVCGGQFGYDSFFQWQELRIRYEWKLPPGSTVKDEEPIFDFSAARALSDLTEAEKQDRKRKLNVIHSRRKRERDRIEAEVLNDQYLEEKGRQSQFKKENARLQGLVNDAQSLLARQYGT